MPNSFKPVSDIANKQSYFSKRFKTFLEKKGGNLNFSDFMAYSLYDEEDGYYSSDKRIRVGTGGDFITSVSVGETFAKLIIERLKPLLSKHNLSSFSFMELGPENGDFATDFLKHWKSDKITLSHYYAIERSHLKAEYIREKLSPFDNCHVREDIPETGEFTIVFANEVLDAFPVHLIEKKGTEWMEVGISLKEDCLIETFSPPLKTELLKKIETLPDDLPSGYRTEVCLGFRPFFNDLSQKLKKSHFMFFDYYLSEEEYFSPHRTKGTLQTYYNHRKDTSPYASVGQVDLSCHVNFNEVKEAAETAGLTVSPPENQGQFLTKYAKSWLLELSPTSPSFQKSIGEFKTLTMPSLFGVKFQVVEMSS